MVVEDAPSGIAAGRAAGARVAAFTTTTPKATLRALLIDGDVMMSDFNDFGPVEVHPEAVRLGVAQKHFVDTPTMHI